jgi:hypothetical protein
VNVLIHEDWRAAIAVRNATDDVVCDAFNTRFLLCYFSLDEIGEAQHLDNAIEKDEVVYDAG